MKDIEQMIDSEGVLRLPEYFNTCNADYQRSLLLRLEVLGHNAFEYLPSLRELYIPASVTKIEWSFYHSLNLKAIHVDEGNPCYCTVDGVLFTKDKTELVAYPNAHGNEYHVPDGTTSVAHFAFKSCGIKTIYLPKSVESVGINAFYECSSLERVFVARPDVKIGHSVDSWTDRYVINYNGKDYSLDEYVSLSK